MADKKTALNRPLGGLFLMILFTIIWVLIAEYYFGNRDFKLVGFIFGAILIYFAYSYWKLSQRKSSLPLIKENDSPQKERLYWIIVALEGIAIFVTNTILINLKKEEFFISCFALIVGLHFIPLAKVFERKFYYYIGVWTILAAITGIALIFQKTFDYQIINAFVCTCCAVSTVLCGLKIINDGNKIAMNYSLA
jgi:hypothetical protein